MIPDPDPAFFRLITDPDPVPDLDPVQIQGFDNQKLKKIAAENFFFFITYS
jgi:hypothetical protein